MEWSARSWVRATLPPKIFLAIFVFGLLAIMFVLCTCAYSVSGVYIIICNVAACIWWHLLYLNFRNIARWLAAILKKPMSPDFNSVASLKIVSCRDQSQREVICQKILFLGLERISGFYWFSRKDWIIQLAKLNRLSNARGWWNLKMNVC